jgi:hypothetical protein
MVARDAFRLGSDAFSKEGKSGESTCDCENCFVMLKEGVEKRYLEVGGRGRGG